MFEKICLYDELTDEEKEGIAKLPNCSIPDCHWKACSDTGKCFAHSTGRIPHNLRFDKIMMWDDRPMTVEESRIRSGNRWNEHTIDCDCLKYDAPR